MSTDAAEEDVFVCYNDFIDSDNLAAALALARATDTRPNTRVIWILEPRQVSLGLSMTDDQVARCKQLLERHFSARGKPMKLLLGGLLKMEDITAIEGLSDDERSVLRLAVKPDYGPKSDAILHGRLMAWDFATCLNYWSQKPVEVFADLGTLSELENPVNLNIHHHEELVSRHDDELKSYLTIMTQPMEQRLLNLRSWYKSCITKAEKQQYNKPTKVRPLEVPWLCDTIRKARSVQFFGGSSMRILRKFIENGVAHKVNCHIQAGSCDLSANLFPTQFNIGLNKEAARFVLHRFSEFSSFTVVPSQPAQSISYPIIGLQKHGGESLGHRILGFNCHESPLAIATKLVTVEKDHAEDKYAMPDLTAFLCALVPGFKGSKLGHVELDGDETLLFKPSTSGIPSYELDSSISLSAEEIDSLFEQLESGKGSCWDRKKDSGI